MKLTDRQIAAAWRDIAMNEHRECEAKHLASVRKFEFPLSSSAYERLAKRYGDLAQSLRNACNLRGPVPEEYKHG